MKVKISNGLAKELFGRMIFLGNESRFEYDSVKREYDETKMVGNTVNIGCEKLSDSITVQVGTLAGVDIPKFADVEFVDLEYDPYATVSTFNSGDSLRSRGVLNERFRCSWIKESGKPENQPGNKAGKPGNQPENKAGKAD